MMNSIKRTDVPTRTNSRNLRSSSKFIGEEGVLSQALQAKLSQSIVWLASYDGKKLHSMCTGIVVQSDQLGASFVTSGHLVTSGDLDTTKHSDYIDKLEIKVYLPNGEVVYAYVQDYIVACSILVVATKSVVDLRPACLQNQMEVERSTKLLAASFCPVSYKFLVTTGLRTLNPTEVERNGIMWSTCYITKAGAGAPLIDFDGNIVGMNLSMTAGATSFVSAKLIVECMIDLGFWIYLDNIPTPMNFGSEGTSSLDTIISSSSQSVSSEGSVNKNQEPYASPNHGANGVWCDLNEELASNLSRRVVSIASFDGEALHSECTGIVINQNLSSASFLTTGSLFGSLHEDLWHNLRIMVRLPNNQTVQAWFHYYSGPSSLAVVITHSLPPSIDLIVARLDIDMQVQSSAVLLAVRRCFSTGKLMSTRGSLTGGIHSEGLNLSTCEIIEAASGGPLVDFDGNIVGINYYDAEINPFLPSCLILKYLGRDIYWSASKDCCSTDMMHKSSTPHSDGPNEVLTDDELRLILAPWQPDGFKRRVNAILRSFGYPLPSFVDDGMYLKWDFEEGFGGDIWNEPTRTKRVTSKMSRSVVALASFLPVKLNDGSEEVARKFACSGVLIGSHESTTRILTSASLVRSPGDGNIDPEWKIEVCLPSKQRVKGKLEYVNLQNNVAVVSISSVHSYRAVKLHGTSQTKVGAQVVALGRGFESGKLMATNGAVIGKRKRFGDEELQISTCKITKAGIGGPLVDFDGNVVGINFYDTEQTPYLSRVVILELMKEINAEQ